MKDILFVNGKITCKSGNHQVKELIAYADDAWRKAAEDNIINSDLIITKDDILIPYQIYCAASDISTDGIFISGMQSPQEVYKIYKQEIDNLQRLVLQEVNDNLKEVLNRQIYIGVVGSMELFLCDFLYSMVLGTGKYYKKFCENSSRTFQLKEISANQWRTQDAVTKAILEKNYHRITEVSKIYDKVLNIKMPKSKKLEDLIMTRHNLVHRNGFPTSKSEYIKVSSRIINELIEEVNNLVSLIIDAKEYEIENWFPKLN